MCIIQVNRLAAADAENLIASLWRVLEEHGMPSPKLRVHQAGEFLRLGIEFSSEEHGKFMKRCVPRLAAEPLFTAPRLICPTQPIVAIVS